MPTWWSETPSRPTTPVNTSDIVRRSNSLRTQVSNPRHVQNILTRAGSASMLSPAGHGNLRARATIDQPANVSHLSVRRHASQTRAVRRSVTFHSGDLPSRFFDDEEEAPMRPDSESAAVTLARKYRLTWAETQNVINSFKDAKKNSAGGIDIADFRSMMCCIFDVSEIKPSVLELAYKQAGMQRSATIEGLMLWYVQNMFMQVNDPNASQDRHQDDSLIYTLSKKHMVSMAAIENIKNKFDKFDLDKSGEIDFEEFTEMMCILLETGKDALSDTRLKKFWREIEKATTGDVGFDGFAAWYLRNFER